MTIEDLTSPDKHDTIIAVLGHRVRVAELAEDSEGKVQILLGETTLKRAKRMLSELPDNHNLGMYNICLGMDHRCHDFIRLIEATAKAKNFNLVITMSHRPNRDVFNDFFRVAGRSTSQGEA